MLREALKGTLYVAALSQAVGVSNASESPPPTPVAAPMVVENAVTQADDAFGLSVGRESIGLYSPYDVRGFSPQAAGNVRLDGLYFDQQGGLSSRVLESSIVRVGLASLDSPFPAPTGIVNYQLRRPEPTSALTAVAYAGPYKTSGIDLDASAPLHALDLDVPLGVSYQTTTVQPGYSADITSVGAAPQWTPTDRITVRAFYDWRKVAQPQTVPLFYMRGSTPPPPLLPHNMAQAWTASEATATNLGGLIDARLDTRWALQAGVFRSTVTTPMAYADLYLDAQSNGSADHVIIGSAHQQVASTSGEVRLIGTWLEGSKSYKPRLHEITVSIRRRDTESLYGGAAVDDLGASNFDTVVQVSKPVFLYGPQTTDRSALWTTGVAYQGSWPNRGEWSFGIQNTLYTNTVIAPDASITRSQDNPWPFYGAFSAVLTRRLTAYAGYTEGLEEAGVAPSTAQNRGEVLPALRTWQREAGLRYRLTQELKLIAGAFDIHKPYINLNAHNVYTALGEERHHGTEISLSGEIAKNTNVVAGAVFTDPQVIVPDNTLAVGAHAIGQPTRTLQFSLDYRLPRWPALSLDGVVSSYGPRATNLDNSAMLPSESSLDLGARYQFTWRSFPATLRVQIQNLTNTYTDAVTGTGALLPGLPRTVLAYLTINMRGQASTH